MNILTKHLNSVNETYIKHLVMAAAISGQLLLASIACFIHALLPFLFERTGSKIVNNLNLAMSDRRASTFGDKAEQK